MKPDPAEEPLFLRALRGQKTARVPFWLMRQAGRYLPEYRALREKAGSFLNLCFDSELAAEVTLQPLRRFDMDAAILFSDILVVPHALGQNVHFVEGEGPRLGPLSDIPDADTGAVDKTLSPVYEAVRRIRRELPPDKALIGFAGAPWTVACYMVQGRGDGAFTAAKKFAFSQPEEFDRLIDVLTSVTAHHLIRQVEAGADAVQIFDSWAGLLPATHVERWCIVPARKIVEQVNRTCPGVPVIGFPRGAGAHTRRYAEETGVNGISLDSSFPLPEAVRGFGKKTTLQGNLDPVFLLAGGAALEKEARRILDETRGVPFIFNLGHGVIKETPPEHVAQLAALIKKHER